MIKEEYFKFLQKFYRKLQENLKFKNKLKNGSVFSTFMDIKSNPRYSFLKEASLEANKIPKLVLEYLLSKEYIRAIDKLDFYTITAKGVWEVETKEFNFNHNTLINILDEKLFSLFKQSGSITDKEKVILLSMITIRAFSEKTFLDLKIGDTILSEMEGLIKDSYNILKTQGFISTLKKEMIFGAKGNEHPVSNLIRHTDGLHKKTKGIYTAIGNQKYYLNLFKNNQISKNDLSYIIWLIFGNKVTWSAEEAINDFCIKNAYGKGIYLYNSNNLIFINPQYDNIIKDAFFEYNINKSKW